MRFSCLEVKRKAKHGVECLHSFMYRCGVTREQKKLTTQMWFKVLKNTIKAVHETTKSGKEIKRKSFGKCLSFIYKLICSGKQEIPICIQIVVRRKPSCDGNNIKRT